MAERFGYGTSLPDHRPGFESGFNRRLPYYQPLNVEEGQHMAYSEKVVDHFNNPRNMGSFKKDEPGLGTGIVGAPECGDVMKLQIKVQDDKIVDAKFKTFGCGSAIASSSLSTEWLKGKTIQEASTIKNTDIVQELDLPPVKIHCSVLAEDAIKAALEDYKKNSVLHV